MKKSLFISILVVLIGGFFASSLVADSNHDRRHDDILVKFKGGIGVIPISNVVVAADGAITVNRNTVRGVNSPGQIWRIGDLKAKVKVNGHIRVDGQGLLLAGGNNIGTNSNQSVRARLFCGTDVHESNLVPLEANGDFKIDDILTPVSPTDTPVPPNPCTTPLLLILNAGGNWFAAGIPDLD
jgi:hypothetical protein